MLYPLVFAAVMLTCAMFLSRQMMLGFASAIFWAVLGGYSYTLSVMTWDVNYFLFFACLFGMTPLCLFGAYALRTQKAAEIDEDEYIDEKGGDGTGNDGFEDREVQPSSRTLALRERAKKRRTGQDKEERFW